MKKIQKLTRAQLTDQVMKVSEVLYTAIEPELEFMFNNGDDPDEDSFSEFLNMLDQETAEKIKEAAFNRDSDDDEPEIMLMENESTTSLDLVTEQGDGYIVILIENDINLTGNLFIEDYVTLIVTGDIKAKNIIVNGSLYCSGNIFCTVLFSASGNDHQTYSAGNMYTSLIAENGQYTVSESKIYSRYLMSFHNTIKGKSGRFIENTALENGNEASVLNPEILDESGFFDEDAFLNYINIHQPESLFI